MCGLSIHWLGVGSVCIVLVKFLLLLNLSKVSNRIIETIINASIANCALLYSMVIRIVLGLFIMFKGSTFTSWLFYLLLLFQVIN